MEKVDHKRPMPIRGAFYFARGLLRGMPRLVNIEFTKKCNARCGFCACWQVESPNELEDYSPIIKMIKPVVVSISGGEPLVRKNYAELISKMRPHCHYINIISNGKLLNKDSAKKLVEAGVDNICVSLDFIGEKHDQMRKIKGLYAQLEKTIPELTSAGYRICLNTVIMDSNLDQIVPIAKKAHEWGAEISFSSYCSLKRDDGAGMIEGEKYIKLKHIINELKKLKKTARHIKSSDYYLDRVPEYFLKGGMPNCRAGKRWIQVTPDGFVQPCSELPRACFYKDYPDWKKQASVPDCTHCWYSCRGEAEAEPLAPKRFVELIRA